MEPKKSPVLKPGTRAPDFCLKATPDQKVGLADFEGKPLVIVFYPADWSPVCGDELALFNEVLPEIEAHQNAGLVGISVDGVWSHNSFAKARGIRFPLLSDFEPKGDVARAYGAYQVNEGLCARALFVIDASGVICWSYLSPVGVNPGVRGVLDALEALDQAGKKSVA